MQTYEKDKRKEIKHYQEIEGGNFEQVIGLQIQKVAKETARLVSLLEGSLQIADIDSSEYKLLKRMRDNIFK